MQHFLLLLLLLIMGPSLLAQVTVEPQQVIVGEVNPDSTQVIGYGRVKNNTDQTRTYRWIRTIRSLSEGWETAVCDTNLCYLPFVDSMEFELTAQLEANLNVYVYPNMQEGSAIVEVKVVDIANPEFSAGAVYYFNAAPSNSRDKESYRRLQVFPNPTRNSFQVTDNQLVDRIRVFNLLGEQIRTFRYVPGMPYHLDQLPRGAYLVQLQDRDGRTLITRRLQKL